MKRPAKKSLGQHYLLNPSTIDKLIRVAGIQPTDRVLEIGPGPGGMTKRLAKIAQHLIAIEKDFGWATQLKKELKPFQNTQVIEADILETDFSKILTGTGWKVISNLPYNIATETTFHLFESCRFFDTLTLMFQKEVAERIVAHPGSKSYGILSVMTQLFSENKIVMQLPPGAFTPPPKVFSAVVHFKINPELRFDIHHLPTFESVVRSAFSQRRKMIRNSLRSSLKNFSPEKIDRALEKAEINPTVRAETVPIDRFVRLANALKGEL